MPEVEIEDVMERNTLAIPSFGIIKKYKSKVIKITNIAKCKSS